MKRIVIVAGDADNKVLENHREHRGVKIEK